MTKQQPTLETAEPKTKRIARHPLTVPAILLGIAILYFLPYLNFQTVLQGTDDMRRGWNTYGNKGHGMLTFADTWSPLNGGTSMAERRFGRFISPMWPLHYVLKKYQQRVIEYIFWVFIAGLFMYWYLREIRIKKPISAVLAIGFMLAPGLLSNIFTGHYVKMEVIALMPGIMAFVERLVRRARLTDIAGLPALLALTVYSEHVQLAYFVFIGSGVYFAARMIHLFVSKQTKLMDALARTAAYTATWVIMFFITAMTTIPMVHHTNVVSKRAGGVTYDYASSFALHPEEVVTFLEPDFVGWKEYYWGRNPLKLNSEYFGTIVLLLAVMLFLLRKQGFERWLLAGMGLIALLFALGPNTPLHRILYETLPGLKSFRAPSMTYIWFYFSAFALAGLAVQEFLAIEWAAQGALRKRLLIFCGVAGGLSFLYLVAGQPFADFWYHNVYPADLHGEQKFQTLTAHMKNLSVGAFFTFAFVAGFIALVYLRMAGKTSERMFLAGLVIILSVDLLRVSYPFMTECAKPKNYFARQEAFEKSVGDFLKKQDQGVYRVHSLLGDQRFYILGIDMVYIFDDFTDKNYQKLINILNQPASDVQFRNVLSLLNAKYVLASSPIPLPGFTELVNSGGFRIYRNEMSFPRAYLAPHIIPVEDPDVELKTKLEAPSLLPDFAFVASRDFAGTQVDTTADSTIRDSVKIVSYDDRKGRFAFDVLSSRGQMLVVSDNIIPGWTATRNGKQTPILATNLMCKGVIVPRGSSHVEMTYRSALAEKWRNVTKISAILYGIFCVLVAIASFVGRRKRVAA